MLTAYFDDSNTSPNQKVAVVAGYLGSTSQWKRFCIDWGKLLDRYGIKAVHRTDLQHGYGEFKDWTPSRRDEFLSEAYVIIKRRSYIPIGAAVVREDFENIMPDMIKAKIGGFYGLCASVCLSGARSWCERHNYGGSIHYVFEAGTPGQGQVNKFLNETYMDELARSEYRLNDFSFADKSMKPLQAADIIAYEMGKHALDKKLQRSRPDVVKYMRDLLGFKSEMDMELKYWDRETLNELLSNYKAGILAQR